MRFRSFWVFGFALLIMAGCAPRQSDDAEAPASPAIENTGCLGRQIPDCIEMLKSEMQIRDTLPGEIDKAVQEQLADNAAAGQSRTLDLQMEMTPYLRRHVVLDYDGANQIRTIQVALNFNPTWSAAPHHSEVDDLILALRIACGTPCDDVSADQFYDFFSTQVKAHLHTGSDRDHRLQVPGYRHYSSVEYITWSDVLSFHGLKFRYAFVDARPFYRYSAIILTK